MVNILIFFKNIDYIWLHYYVKLTMENCNNKTEMNFNSPNKDITIIDFIETLKIKAFYKNEIMIISLFHFTNFCAKYAHVIDNYTFLFSMCYYIAYNKYYEDKYLPIITEVFEITNETLKKYENYLYFTLKNTININCDQFYFIRKNLKNTKNYLVTL